MNLFLLSLVKDGEEEENHQTKKKKMNIAKDYKVRTLSSKGCMRLLRALFVLGELLVDSIKLYVGELNGESSTFIAFGVIGSGKTYTIQADASDASSFPSILLCNKIDISNVALIVGLDGWFGAEGDDYDSDAQEEVKEEEATRKKEVTSPVSNGFDLTS
ncbi:hypothetical protein Tco_0984005 [Tanacetum coccineum]